MKNARFLFKIIKNDIIYKFMKYMKKKKKSHNSR